MLVCNCPQKKGKIMGTRSIIAKPYGDIWRGRYCHWDGYPQHNGSAIFQLVQRDGLEVARKTLVDDNFYWSSINPLAEGTQYEGDERFKFVQGYGTAGTELQADPDEWWTPNDLDDAWIEWVYILAEEGLLILDAGKKVFGYYPWILQEPIWQLEEKKYSNYSDGDYRSAWAT